MPQDYGFVHNQCRGIVREYDSAGDSGNIVIIGQSKYHSGSEVNASQ